MAIRDEKRLRKIRAILVRRRRELLDELDRTDIASKRASRPSGIGDVMDRASSNLLTEEMLTLEENGRKELSEVDEALWVLEHGEYGCCQQCGRLIGTARLKAIPQTTLCIECRRLMDSTLEGALHAEARRSPKYIGEEEHEDTPPRQLSRTRATDIDDAASRKLFHQN